MNIAKNRAIRKFLTSKSGETSLQIAMFFGALSILIAIAATPFLDKASKTYAENGGFGIDTVTTGSVEKTKRYTIRKSILDNAER